MTPLDNPQAVYWCLLALGACFFALGAIYGRLTAPKPPQAVITRGPGGRFLKAKT